PRTPTCPCRTLCRPQRYLDTRRRHPHTPDTAGDRTLTDAIHHEEGLLGALAESADLVLDTSTMSVHELRDIIRDRVADQPRNQVDRKSARLNSSHVK